MHSWFVNVSNNFQFESILCWYTYIYSTYIWKVCIFTIFSHYLHILMQCLLFQWKVFPILNHFYAENAYDFFFLNFRHSQIGWYQTFDLNCCYQNEAYHLNFLISYIINVVAIIRSYRFGRLNVLMANPMKVFDVRNEQNSGEYSRLEFVCDWPQNKVDIAFVNISNSYL